MAIAEMVRMASAPDEFTRAIFLDMPASQIVLLQGFFELYDGLGTVRTIEKNQAMVCVLTTPSQIEETCRVLEGLRGEIQWRQIECTNSPLD